ncbi:hypothetical protein GCM10009754_20680 [Amycolatopsis minnesotensis]|uniref:Uncharacterized protein n=1 Tax=Amycolatopsis minnesotensis TaxID=337894 RepID=A0ABN2QJH3_9PSEU
MRPVVVEGDLAQPRLGHDLGLVAEHRDRGIGMGGEHEDPQVVLKRHPTVAEPEPGQVLEDAPIEVKSEVP